ncbi:EpsG family protein [Aeromonas veronii]|uniref:EpsG family protein n=1 Tax=Aeromonas veronii TaxID=654 RepID=UPI0038D33D3B
MFWVFVYSIISIYSITGLYLYKNKISVDISKYFALLSFISSGIFIFSLNYNRDIMSDSIGYSAYFQTIRVLDFTSILTYQDNFEIGFRLWNWMIGLISERSEFFFAITALTIFLVTQLSLLNIFNRYVAMFTSFLYVGLPWFALYSASGIRQGLALSFVTLSLSFLLKRRNYISLIYFLIAVSFHRTAIIIFPAYAVILLKVKPKQALIIYSLLVIGAVSDIFGSVVRVFLDVDSLSPREKFYFSGTVEEYKTGFRMDFFIFSIFPLVIYYLIGRYKLRTDDIDKWIIIYLAINSLMLIFSFIPYYDRVAAFSWYLYPILLSMMLFKLKNNIFSFVGLSALCVVNIIIFRFYNWGWYFSV